MNRTTLIAAFASLLTPVLSGCGVNPSVALRDSVTAPALVNFPRESVRLKRIDLFLWPQDVTASKMARVLKISDEVDDLERASGPRNDALDSLSDELAPLLSDIERKERACLVLKGKIKKKQDELKAAPEAEKEGIQKVIQDLTQEKQTLEGTVEGLKGNDKYKKKLALEAEKETCQDKLNHDLDELKKIVSYFDPPPTSFNFQFNLDGTFAISIADWMLDPEEGPRDFSSKPSDGSAPTITNVEYTELGGRVSFDVRVNDLNDPSRLKFIYQFQIARVNYNRNDGKTYFAGDLFKKVPRADGTFDVSRGIAKLVDKNN